MSRGTDCHRTTRPQPPRVIAHTTELRPRTPQATVDRRSARHDRPTFPSVNPATGDVIGHAPDAGTDEAAAAIAAARRAFDTTSWSTDVALRVRCLEQLHQALLDHAEELRDADDCRSRRNPRADPRRPTRRADQDREVLRRRPARAMRSPRNSAKSSRGACGTAAGWRKKPPAWSARSSPTTTRTSSHWPSWRPRSPPAAPSYSRARRTLRW